MKWLVLVLLIIVIGQAAYIFLRDPKRGGSVGIDGVDSDKKVASDDMPEAAEQQIAPAETTPEPIARTEPAAKSAAPVAQTEPATDAPQDKPQMRSSGTEIAAEGDTTDATDATEATTPDPDRRPRWGPPADGP